MSQQIMVEMLEKVKAPTSSGKNVLHYTSVIPASIKNVPPFVRESLHIYFGFIRDFTDKMADALWYTAFAERLSGVTPSDSCTGR